MSKKCSTPNPNLATETFIATVKIFTVILLVVIVFNNLAWIYSVSKPSHVGDSRIEINQNGNHDIKQKIES